MWNVIGALALVTVASPARAQLRWDAQIAGGALKRFTSGPVSTSVSPAAGASVHLAVLPLVRGGLYGSLDSTFLAGGLRAKVLAPPLGPFQTTGVRPFFAAGVGYAAPYTGPQAPAGPGGMVEVPLTLGATWPVRKPWGLTLELTGRLGAVFGLGALVGVSFEP